jgi:hypothetical protein
MKASRMIANLRELRRDGTSRLVFKVMSAGVTRLNAGRGWCETRSPGFRPAPFRRPPCLGNSSWTGLFNMI